MLRAISILWVLLTASCAGTGDLSRLENCPVTPMAVEDLPQGLILRARVRMSARNHEASFEVIAHATTKELTLVGIAPVNHDLGAALRQLSGHRSTVTVGSARHQADLSLEPTHDSAGIPYRVR